MMEKKVQRIIDDSGKPYLVEAQFKWSITRGIFQQSIAYVYQDGELINGREYAKRFTKEEAIGYINEQYRNPNRKYEFFYELF
jgi:hypothetical protein